MFLLPLGQQIRHNQRDCQQVTPILGPVAKEGFKQGTKGAELETFVHFATRTHRQEIPDYIVEFLTFMYKAQLESDFQHKPLILWPVAKEEFKQGTKGTELETFVQLMFLLPLGQQIRHNLGVFSFLTLQTLLASNPYFGASCKRGVKTWNKRNRTRNFCLFCHSNTQTRNTGTH
jgi:hypothetical protein